MQKNKSNKVKHNKNKTKIVNKIVKVIKIARKNKMMIKMKIKMKKTVKNKKVRIKKKKIRTMQAITNFLNKIKNLIISNEIYLLD